MYKEKKITIEAALIKMEMYCSQAEHCSFDIHEKLKKYDLNEKQANEIVKKLCEEKYIDDSRYCRCYALDKFRYNHWGRIKIYQSLRQKGIGKDIIENALQEIDEEEYLNILLKLLKQKNKNICYQSEYDRKGKLTRFAAGKGFEINLITKVLNVEEDYQD